MYGVNALRKSLSFGCLIIGIVDVIPGKISVWGMQTTFDNSFGARLWSFS
jgi:hypothetical protein